MLLPHTYWHTDNLLFFLKESKNKKGSVYCCSYISIEMILKEKRLSRKEEGSRGSKDKTLRMKGR